ncbi:hypothetical protein L6Q96_19165 [Candidatus Binatia bacterium]|nr:hypothetical protein [Candidatus Binatia bacterium]
MQNGVGVEAWMAMLREVGLSDADMQRWHAIFEEKHPEQHASFLEWLGLPVEDIAAVRRRSRQR